MTDETTDALPTIEQVYGAEGARQGVHPSVLEAEAGRRALAALRAIRDEIARAEAYAAWMRADEKDWSAFDMNNPPPLSGWVPTTLSWEDRALEWVRDTITRGLGEEPCVQCGAPVYAGRTVTIDDGRHEGEALCSFACAERQLLDEITPRRGEEAKE